MKSTDLENPKMCILSRSSLSLSYVNFRKGLLIEGGSFLFYKVRESIKLYLLRFLMVPKFSDLIFGRFYVWKLEKGYFLKMWLIGFLLSASHQSHPLFAEESTD